MNISSKLKIMAIATLIVAGCSQADARRPHRHHIHYPARVVVIPTPVHRNVVTKHVSNRFSQKERLAMALAYLNNNQRIGGIAAAASVALLLMIKLLPAVQNDPLTQIDLAFANLSETDQEYLVEIYHEDFFLNQIQ